MSMNICLNPGTVLGRLQYDSDQKEKGPKLGSPFLTQRCRKVIHSSMNIVNEYLPKPITVLNKPRYLRTAAARLPWTGFPTAWSSFKKTNFWKTQALAGSTVLIVVCVCVYVCVWLHAIFRLLIHIIIVKQSCLIFEKFTSMVLKPAGTFNSLCPHSS